MTRTVALGISLYLAFPTLAIPSDNVTGLSGLIAYYALDGNALDSSGNDAHGTVVGAKATRGVSGIRSTAFQFDGKDDYIHLPVNLNPNQFPQLTITLWARAHDLDRRQVVFSTDNGGYDRSIRLSANDRVEGWTMYCGRRVAVLGSRPAVKRQWVFVAAVYDQERKTVDLYVDDQHFMRKNCELGIGRLYARLGENPGYGKNFCGKIDEVRIFNRALNPLEISGVAALATRHKDKPTP